MTLVLHLIRCDMRRFRILLSLWLLLIGASAVLDGIWPAMAVAVATRQTVGLAGHLLALAEVLFSIALITLVVQEHRLVGTTAFWMTRPIPPGALFAAKCALLTAAMVVAPVLAEIVLMVVYRVPADEIAAVAAQSSIFWALWLGIVMAFAAFTPNMAKFALAVGGVIVATIVLLMTIATIFIDRFDDMPPIQPAGKMNDPTGGVVSTLVFIGAVVLFLAFLYRTRSRPRAVAIGVAGVAVAWAAAGVWPWPMLAPTFDTPAWASDPSVLQLSANSSAVKVAGTTVDFGAPPPPWLVARGPMRLTGLAPGWSARAGVRETSIRVEGHEALTSHVRAAPASVAIDDAESVQNHEVIRRLLNVERLIDRRQETRAESAVVMVARASDLRRIPADRGAYDGTFVLSLTRHDIEAVLPFRSGAAVRIGTYQFAVDRIRPSRERMSVLARESDARSVFDRHPLSRVDYYLRNAQTSVAVEGSYRELRSDVTLARFLPFMVGVGAGENEGFRALALEVNFSTAYGGANELVFDDSWLERAELVIVRSTEGGRVERRVSMPDFPIR
jgi:hypothetical protein